VSLDALAALGLDESDLDWTDLAICRGLPREKDENGNPLPDPFYEKYESDEEHAKVIDAMCLSCPVMAQCLEAGMDNGESGTWGGIYLTAGRPDDVRNAHKTQEVWDRIRSRLADS
jgi:hypothetical protein